MKTPNETQTAELLGMPQGKKRGRPATGHAKSAAERMREYRARAAERKADFSQAMKYLGFCFDDLDALPCSENLNHTLGAINAVHWAGLITAEECHRAHEWAFAIRRTVL